MSQKARVLNHFLRFQGGFSALDFSDLLYSAAESALGLTAMDAEYFVRGKESSFWQDLKTQIDHHKSNGILPYYRVVDDSGRKLKRQHIRWPGGVIDRSRLMRVLDAFNWNQYEACGPLACWMLGKGRIRITRSGNDAGVDFFAVVEPLVKNHVFTPPNRRLRIVGQAKKYTAPAKVGVVDQFLTNVSELRFRSEKISEAVPYWFAQERGPVVGWLISHSGFQSGAVEKGKSHGVVLADTVDVCEMIASGAARHQWSGAYCERAIRETARQWTECAKHEVQDIHSMSLE